MVSSQIRANAREALKGKWGKVALIILVYTVFTITLSFLETFFDKSELLSLLLSLATLIISVPLSFGLTISFMKLKRDEEVSSFDFLKEGFSRFGKSWGIQWYTFLKLLLPLILGIIIFLIIPLILSFIVSSTSMDPGLSMSGLLVIVYASPLLVIWIFPKYLLYILAHNICYDNPEFSSKECVLKSAELMKGNRVKYFKLCLSFIGWYFLIYIVYYIVVSISFKLLGVQIVAGNVGQIGNQIGILLGYLIMVPGILFLISYMQVSTVCFYEKVAKFETINAEPAEKIEE